MSLLVGLRPGLNAGIDGATSGAGVTQDGPSGVYVPQSAAEFQALGLAVPDWLWLCQEASGNLAATIGSVPLVPTASPLFRQPVPGWGRYFVGTADDTVGQRFSTNDAALNVAAGESFAWLVYIAIANSTGGNRRVLPVQGAINGFLSAFNGTLATFVNGAAVSSVLTYNDLTVVRPLVWFRNATTNQSGSKSDRNQVVVTHDESAFAGQLKGLGAAGAETPTATRACLMAAYKGANAEQDWPAYIRRLGWTLGY